MYILLSKSFLGVPLLQNMDTFIFQTVEKSTKFPFSSTHLYIVFWLGIEGALLTTSPGLRFGRPTSTIAELYKPGTITYSWPGCVVSKICISTEQSSKFPL